MQYDDFTRNLRASKILRALYTEANYARIAPILTKDESFVIHIREVRVFLYGGKYSFPLARLRKILLHCSGFSFGGTGEPFLLRF